MTKCWDHNVYLACCIIKKFKSAGRQQCITGSVTPKVPHLCSPLITFGRGLLLHLNISQIFNVYGLMYSKSPRHDVHKHGEQSLGTFGVTHPDKRGGFGSSWFCTVISGCSPGCSLRTRDSLKNYNWKIKLALSGDIYYIRNFERPRRDKFLYRMGSREKINSFQEFPYTPQIINGHPLRFFIESRLIQPVLIPVPS